MHPTEKNPFLVASANYQPCKLRWLICHLLGKGICVADGKKVKFWSDKEWMNVPELVPWSVLSLILLQLSNLHDSRSPSDHNKALLALLSSLQWRGRREQRGGMCWKCLCCLSRHPEYSSNICFSGHSREQGRQQHSPYLFYNAWIYR